MFTVLQIRDAWPFVVSVSMTWCNIEGLKKIAIQNDHEMLQKSKQSLSDWFYLTHFPQ